MEKFRKALIHIILPLLAGVLVYILFREPNTPLHHWLGIQKKPITHLTLPSFWLFQFSDACWAYALSASLLLFTTLSRPLAATFGLIFLSLVEAQQSNWNFSRLDWTDLITMFLSFFLAMVIIKKK